MLVGAGSLNLQTSNTLSGLYDADNLLINKMDYFYIKYIYNEDCAATII